MKKMTAILALILTSSTTYAGSYNFECTAYSMSKSGQIDKLTMNREEATLDNFPGIFLELIDPNIDLLAGEQTYESKNKRIVVKVTVTATNTIASLEGNIGPRDHNVHVTSVNIKLNHDGITKNFVGSCTETTISTCGGSCN